MDRSFRSRTSSTSSLRSPNAPTPAHTPNVFRASHPSLSPDQLAAGLSRVRAEQGSRASSIPPTPSSTPNPHHVSYSPFPEQLAAGIKQLRVDEGYIDSTSIPATPAPSPFSPSPAQFTVFSPDQVAEGIQKLREQGVCSATSGASSGQPPTPSTTPGIVGGAHHQLGIIPEHLVESIHHLRTDEGVESTSNPGTPVPTPISPSPALHRTQVLPEQLAAGIHRLKVEEGMSSGGSSGFPSTPAPTPFCHHPGGVRPEDLAAGISRLSVIEESDISTVKPNISINVMDEVGQPNLSQYFGGGAVGDVEKEKSPTDTSFFDQFSEEQPAAESSPATAPEPAVDPPTEEPSEEPSESLDTSVLHSCRESRVDLDALARAQEQRRKESKQEAEIDVVEQSFDDSRSLQHRYSMEDKRGSFDEGRSVASEGSDNSVTRTQSLEPKVCTIFSETAKDALADPFDTIVMTPERPRDPPKSLTTTTAHPMTEKAKPIVTTSSSDNTPTPTNSSSNYSTPVAPTPVAITSPVEGGDSGIQSYSTYAPTPSSQLFSQPITSPLPIGDRTAAALPVEQPIGSPADEGLILPDQSSETLQNTELDRRHEVWIPCSATRQTLSNIAASTPGTFYPNRSDLTMPGVVVREELTDPVTNLVNHYRGEAEASRRQALTVESVTQDQRGLRQLIQAGSYRAAVNLTARLLQMYNQGPGQGGNMTKHTPSSLQLWFTRLALLIKLKQFSIAEVEAEPFGDLDRPDLYYQYYPEMYGTRTGSMVPFGFRLLVAEIPQHLGKHHETLDRLYRLLGTAKKILDNLSKSDRLETGEAGTLADSDRRDSVALWKNRELRIMYSLVNCSIMQKDYELAVTTLNMLVAREADAKKPKLLSALGRIFLQLGDISAAEKSFSAARALRGTSPADRCETLVDTSFVYMANNQFDEALNALQQASEFKPNDPVIVNNISVCLLYLGRLKEGLQILESNMTLKPNQFLHEVPILNLCTLYELESGYAGQKKQGLLGLVSQYKGDGINPACLKLQM